jgi:hypothetical protein
MNENEVRRDSTNILKIPDEFTVACANGREFNYDSVFGPHVGQEEVFADTKRLI